METWCKQAYRGNTNAAVVLKELGTNAIPELIRLLKLKDSFVRKQVWRHLPSLPLRVRQAVAGKYPPPQAEAMREAAARALGRLGADARPAISALTSALRDPEGRVRWEAASALASMGKQSVPVLINSLEESGAKTRHAAVYALGLIGPKASGAVPALTRRLDDQDAGVRNSAAYSLATVGLTGVMALLEARQQGSLPARLAAEQTLTNSYLPTLKATREFFQMTRSESPAERRQALLALGAIRPVGSTAIHASLEALEDPALEVQVAAIQTLGAKGGANQNAVQALMHCLKAETPRVREEAARALGAMGQSARSAASELARLAHDPEAAVGAAATAALERMGEVPPAPAEAPESPRAN